MKEFNFEQYQEANNLEDLRASGHYAVTLNGWVLEICCEWEKAEEWLFFYRKSFGGKLDIQFIKPGETYTSSAGQTLIHKDGLFDTLVTDSKQ